MHARSIVSGRPPAGDRRGGFLASGVAWAQFRAVQAVPKGDAAALDQACRDAWASARQAQPVGGSAPTAENLLRTCQA